MSRQKKILLFLVLTDAFSTLSYIPMIPAAAIRFIRNRRPGGNRKSAPRGARGAPWILAGIVGLDLSFVAGSVLWLNQPNVLSVTPLISRIVLGLGVVSAALTVGALVYTVLAWKNSYWGITARVYYTLVAFAAFAVVWFLNYWNLLGWRL